jgi:sortase A
MVTGTLLAIEAALTITWQEPLTAILASRSEGELARQLDALGDEIARAEPARKAPDTSLESALKPAIKRVERRVEVGHAMGRIKVEALDLESPYVQGADLSSLQKAPGHYVDTNLPGEGGTVGIAGHRTTYGAPFGDIDDLRRGDKISIEMPYGDFSYAVTRKRIVEPEAVDVLRRGGKERIVLTACHPRFSAARRIVAFAALRKAMPERAMGWARH